MTIDKKHVSLNGITNTSFQRVYGNDDTVYLTAETAVIQDNTGDKENAIIINGADAPDRGRAERQPEGVERLRRHQE